MQKPLEETKSGRMRALHWALSGAGFVILVWFTTQIDFGGLVSGFRELRWPFLVEAVLFTGLNVALKALRWQTIVYRALGVHVPWGQAVAAVLAGVAGASFVPGRSFDAAKPLLLRVSHGVPVSNGIPAVIAERILDLVALLLLFLVTVAVGRQLALLPSGSAVSATAVGLTLVLLAFLFGAGRGLDILQRWLAVRFPRFRVRPFLASLRSAADLMCRSGRSGAVALYSLGAIVAEVARTQAVFRAFGVDLPCSVVAFSFTTSILIGLLAFIPGGVGITETFQAGLVALLAPQAASAIVHGAVLLDRVLSYYLLVIVGSLVLVAAFRIRMRGEEAREAAYDRAQQGAQEAAL